MTPFADTSHRRDDQNVPALLSSFPQRLIPNRPIGGKTHSINQHPRGVERAAPEAVFAPEDYLGDATLAFDAIHDAFLAQRAMLRAFAQQRGDDDAVVLW